MKIMDEIQKYDVVFQNKWYRSITAAQGIKYIGPLIRTISFKTILDVGCGPGWAIREFLRKGYAVEGIEPCQYLYQHELKDLNIIHQAKADTLPFGKNAFDLVFCTDVMEHIPENEIQQSFSEMVRVSAKYLYFTICSHDAKLFPELQLHCTVKPREWWTKQLSNFALREIPYGGDNEYLYIKD